MARQDVAGEAGFDDVGDLPDDHDVLRSPRLRDAGIKVDEKVESEENGRFAWAIDPEGNRFELWEPKPGY